MTPLSALLPGTVVTVTHPVYKYDSPQVLGICTRHWKRID